MKSLALVFLALCLQTLSAQAAKLVTGPECGFERDGHCMIDPEPRALNWRANAANPQVGICDATASSPIEGTSLRIDSNGVSSLEDANQNSLSGSFYRLLHPKLDSAEFQNDCRLRGSRLTCAESGLVIDFDQPTQALSDRSNPDSAMYSYAGEWRGQPVACSFYYVLYGVDRSHYDYDPTAPTVVYFPVAN